MSKFLAGCHYNEEEISRHLENNIGYGPVQINDNKFVTGQILRKPVEVVKGQKLAGCGGVELQVGFSKLSCQSNYILQYFVVILSSLFSMIHLGNTK
jgi:hypothetical protein